MRYLVMPLLAAACAPELDDPAFADPDALERESVPPIIFEDDECQRLWDDVEDCRRYEDRAINAYQSCVAAYSDYLCEYLYDMTVQYDRDCWNLESEYYWYCL